MEHLFLQFEVHNVMSTPCIQRLEYQSYVHQQILPLLVQIITLVLGQKITYNRSTMGILLQWSVPHNLCNVQYKGASNSSLMTVSIPFIRWKVP